MTVSGNPGDRAEWVAHQPAAQFENNVIASVSISRSGLFVRLESEQVAFATGRQDRMLNAVQHGRAATDWQNGTAAVSSVLEPGGEPVCRFAERFADTGVCESNGPTHWLLPNQLVPFE